MVDIEERKRTMQIDLQRRYDELTKVGNSTFLGGLAIVFGLAIVWDQFIGNASHSGETLLAIAVVAIICGGFAFTEKRRKDKLAQEILLKMQTLNDSPKSNS